MIVHLCYSRFQLAYLSTDPTVTRISPLIRRLPLHLRWSLLPLGGTAAHNQLLLKTCVCKARAVLCDSEARLFRIGAAAMVVVL